MKKLFLRISRHCDTSREVAIRKAFGDDVIIVTQDLTYGDSAPWRSVDQFVKQMLNDYPTDELEPGQSVELSAIEIAGPEAKIIDIVKHCNAYTFVRPVFRRDSKGRVVIIGKDANDRDILDIEGYERLSVEMCEAVVGNAL